MNCDARVRERDPLNGSARAYARRLAGLQARLRRFCDVLEDQYGSTFLLRFAHCRAPPLSVRCDRHVIGTSAPPAHPGAGRKRRRQMSPVTLPQASSGAALFCRAALGSLDDGKLGRSPSVRGRLSAMPRNYLVFGDMEANLDVLRVECPNLLLPTPSLFIPLLLGFSFYRRGVRILHLELIG
jgi:hypothetical protein